MRRLTALALLVAAAFFLKTLLIAVLFLGAALGILATHR